MTKRHKHYDVIIAFAEGKTIQYRHPEYGGWEDVDNPHFVDSLQYRVKPTVLRYRNYLYSYDGIHFYIAVATPDTPVNSGSDFHKWIGDWQEVEVNV